MFPTKKCRVCGGKATGFNYGGQLSCESCKVFFHRNANRHEMLKCKHSENCSIDFFSTNKCSRCRLLLCFAIGMKPRLKNEKQKKESVKQAILDRPNALDSCIFDYITTKTLENKPQSMTDVHNQQSKILSTKKSRLPVQLIPFELELIQQVQSAIAVFKDEREARVVGRVSTVKQLYNSPALTHLFYIRKIINYCQKFDVFNGLSNEDQLATLKPFFFFITNIRITFHYQEHIDGFLMFSDETANEVLIIGNEINASYRNQEYCQQLLLLCTKLYHCFDNDVNIRNLLCAISLFREQQNLKNPENIRYHFYLFCQILQRYMQYKYGSRKEGNEKYSTLMRIMNKFEMLRPGYKQLLAEEIVSQNIPLAVREVYDLV